MAECYGSMLAERAQDDADLAANMGDALADCAERMQRELIRAVEHGEQARSMPTPGAHKASLELWEVFADWLCEDDNAKLALAVLTTAVNSRDPAARIQGQAALARFAQQYSDLHPADELAAQDDRDDMLIPAPVFRAHHDPVTRAMGAAA